MTLPVVVLRGEHALTQSQAPSCRPRNQSLRGGPYLEHEEGERQRSSAQAHYNLMRAGACEAGTQRWPRLQSYSEHCPARMSCVRGPKQAVYKQHY